MDIPLVDLKSQLKFIKKEALEKVESILDKCNFILGDEVSQFEKEFAAYINAKYCIGVANGTDALHLSIRAANIGHGDEVIVPANTFIATALGVTLAGATPVFVDINEKNFLLDVNQAKRQITSKTKAIIPVHLYGRMMDLTELQALAQKHQLTIIEDAAQAHGARLNGKYAGTIGVMGCFSFYPGKNLGAFGDGGLIATNSDEIYDKVIALRNYGSPKKYHHPVIGFNSRLDTLQAAFLSIKLKFLDQYNNARYEAATKYVESLNSISDIILPEIPPKGSHVFHLFVIRTSRRDELLQYLNDKGIGAGIHYPIPIHLQGAYKNLGYTEGSFPVTEKLAKEILSLPIFPEISDEQIKYITDHIKKYFKFR